MATQSASEIVIAFVMSISSLFCYIRVCVKNVYRLSNYLWFFSLIHLHNISYYDKKCAGIVSLTSQF